MLPPQPIAFAKIKAFCTSILKTLAPPLLREIDSTLRAEAEPFTPKRVTRRTTALWNANSSTQVKKASVAESVLLKALGITPSDLAVQGEDLETFRHLFDSPMSENHLRAVAKIFGKVVPVDFEPAPFQVAVSAH
jgi:hypothetical protein